MSSRRTPPYTTFPDGLSSLRKIQAALIQSATALALHASNKVSKIKGKQDFSKAAVAGEMQDVTPICILAYATHLCWNAKVACSKDFEAYNLDSRFSSSLPVSKSEAHMASDSGQQNQDLLLYSAFIHTRTADSKI